MKENNYRSLIKLLFETDKFINEITDALAFNHPIFTQDILPAKKQIPTSSTSSNSKKNKWKLVKNIHGYNLLEKRTTQHLRKKAIGKEMARMIFLKDLKSNSTSEFFGPCYLGKKCKNQN